MYLSSLPCTKETPFNPRYHILQILYDYRAATHGLSDVQISCSEFQDKNVIFNRINEYQSFGQILHNAQRCNLPVLFTVIVINPPEKKLAKCISVQCLAVCCLTTI